MSSFDKSTGMDGLTRYRAPGMDGFGRYGSSGMKGFGRYGGSGMDPMDFDEVYELNDGCGLSSLCGPCDNFRSPCGTSSSCDPCGMVGNSCSPCGTSSSCSTGIDEKPCISKCCWQVFLDATCYNPEDIIVYAENNKIIVEFCGGFSEWECGPLCSKNSKREFELPKEFNPDDVTVYFSCDCILVITVTRCKFQCYPIQCIGPARCYLKGNKGSTCYTTCCTTCCEDGKQACGWKPKTNSDETQVKTPDKKSETK